MATSISSLPTAQGKGSVSGAPNLPKGFTDTFSSRYVDTGKIRLHAVIGGTGPPLLLVHGWPQTWYAWRMLMPTLARDFQVIAVDQRGIGLSDKPEEGYDSATVAADLVAMMEVLGHRRFAVYGTDTGLVIAYALAADHPDRVACLIVSEAPLFGVAPPLPLILPNQVNETLWHIPFNATAEINERLVKGREDVYFGNEFDKSAARKLPDDAVRYYVDMLRSPEALHTTFAFYRAFNTSIAQNEQRKTRKLPMPVLAMGGAYSTATSVGDTFKLVSDNVQTVVIPGAAHWIAEEAPDDVLKAVSAFLAPYKNAAQTTAGAR